MKKKVIKIVAVITGLLLTIIFVTAFVLLSISVGMENPGRGPKNIPEDISSNYPEARIWADSLQKAHLLKDTLFIMTEDSACMPCTQKHPHLLLKLQ